MLLVHREDRVMFWRSLTCLPILLIPAVFGLPDGLLGPLSGLVIWFAVNDMNFLLHQHVHCPWTTVPILNRIVDVLLSLTTGMSAYNWRIFHLLRHHKRDDTWGQAYEWEHAHPTFLGGMSYSLRSIPIVLLYPLADSFRHGFLRPKETDFSYRIAFFEQSVVMAFMVCLMSINPKFYCPYYLAVYFFSRLVDYQNHVACDHESQYDFSNNSLNPCYNWVRYNFGFHTAHHYWPSAHWTELPSLHEKISPLISPRRNQTSAWTGLLTPPLLAYWVAVAYERLTTRQSSPSQISGDDDGGKTGCT